METAVLTKTEILKVESPNTGVMLTSAQAALDDVRALVIADDQTYQFASMELEAIKGRQTRLENQRKAITRPLDEAKNRIMAMFRPPCEMLELAERSLKQSLLTYRSERERIASQLRQAAEDAVRRERERLAREAAEVEARARKKADEERCAAEAARAAGDAARAARLETKAAQTEAAGAERADALTLQSQLVTAPAVAAEPVKVAGQSMRVKWKARVSNKSALIAFVSKQPQFENLLEVNESALNRLAASLEGKIAIDGCQCYTEAILGSRTAA